MVISAICFAFGSTVFACLFVRARNIPVPLAWLGMVASLILMVALPLQVASGASVAATWFVWLPMLVFELVFAWWLIVRGVTGHNIRRTWPMKVGSEVSAKARGSLRASDITLARPQPSRRLSEVPSRS